MSKFKVGDRVKFNNDGSLATIMNIPDDNHRYIELRFDEYKSGGGGDYDSEYGGNYYCVVMETSIELVSEVKNNNMNIKEQFLLAITAEPQKSFRKTGITNGDDLLTDDGQKVFLSWLLKKNQDEFKKEVVDPILEDMEKEKK